MPNQYTPVTKRRAVTARKHRWAESQKIEAVTTYMILGSLKLTSGALKIPFDTLKVWKSSEWWKTLEAELRVQEDLQLSNRLKKIVGRTMDVVEDRLENGDFVFDQKTGDLRRKPVNMKDAHKVGLDLALRKDTLIDRHLSNDSVSTDKVEAMLKNLADEFARIANQPAKRDVVVTDVIFGAEDAKEKP